MDKLTLAAKIATAPSWEHFRWACARWIETYGPGVPRWALDAFMKAHPLTPEDYRRGLGS